MRKLNLALCFSLMAAVGTATADTQGVIKGTFFIDPKTPQNSVVISFALDKGAGDVVGTNYITIPKAQYGTYVSREFIYTKKAEKTPKPGVFYEISFPSATNEPLSPMWTHCLKSGNETKPQFWLSPGSTGTQSFNQTEQGECQD